MRALLLRLFAVAIAVATMSITGTAHASPYIGLSWDGRNWASALTGPLLDSERLWTPGDSETTSFYVRNQGPSPGYVDIALLTSDGDDLMRHDQVEIEVRAAGTTRTAAQPWVRIGEDGARHQLVVPAGHGARPLEVQVRVTFRPEAGNDSQSSRLDFDLAIGIDGRPGDAGWLLPISGGGTPPQNTPTPDADGTEQAISGAFANAGADTSNGAVSDIVRGVLPRTGSDLRWWSVFAAAAAVGVGIALVRRRGVGAQNHD